MPNGGLNLAQARQQVVPAEKVTTVLESKNVLTPNRMHVDNVKPGLQTTQSYTGHNPRKQPTMRRAESAADLRSVHRTLQTDRSSNPVLIHTGHVVSTAPPHHIQRDDSITPIHNKARPVSTIMPMRARNLSVSSGRSDATSSQDAVLSTYSYTPISKVESPEISPVLGGSTHHEDHLVDTPSRGNEDRVAEVIQVPTSQSSRKIMDLEIRNTSLLAVNSLIEKRARDQAKEIRELRKHMADMSKHPRLRASDVASYPPVEVDATLEVNSDFDSSTKSLLLAATEVDQSIARATILSESLLAEARRGLAYRPRDSEIMVTRVLDEDEQAEDDHDSICSEQNQDL